MGGAMGVAASAQSAAQLAARFMQQAGVVGGAAAPISVGGGTGVQVDVASAHYEADLEINDFPQHARWKVRPAQPLDPALVRPAEPWTLR